jgi:hypothetical protein
LVKRLRQGEAHDNGEVGSISPMRVRVPRAPLPAHERQRTGHDETDAELGMSHEDLVEALRTIDGLQDVGNLHPNFQFRSRPFLHFHVDERGIYADVRFGNGDFEPVWAATPAQRAELLARVCDHVERITRSRKTGHGKSRR